MRKRQALNVPVKMKARHIGHTQAQMGSSHQGGPDAREQKGTLHPKRRAATAYASAKAHIAPVRLQNRRRSCFHRPSTKAGFFPPNTTSK